MSKCNVDIRTSAIKSNVFLWELANELGISEPTITRKLRAELSAEEKNRYLEAIAKISAQKNNALC